MEQIPPHLSTSGTLGTYLSHLHRELRRELSSYDAYNNVILKIGWGGIRRPNRPFVNELHIKVQRPLLRVTGMLDIDEIHLYLKGESNTILVKSESCGPVTIMNKRGTYILKIGQKYGSFKMELDSEVAKILLYKLGLLYEKRKKLVMGDEI